MPLHPYTEALLSAVPIPKAAPRPQARHPDRRRAEPDQSAAGLPFPRPLPYAMPRCRTDADVARGRGRAISPPHALHDGGVKVPLVAVEWTASAAEGRGGLSSRPEGAWGRSAQRRASRMPSPSRLKAEHGDGDGDAGEQHQPPWRHQPGVERIGQHVAPGRGRRRMPTPRKPSDASITMATPRWVVARIGGATHCGRM